VARGDGEVGLVVEGAGDPGDGAARDELADEDDAALEAAVGFAAADVEAEVDLLKARVQRDGEALDADAVEEEGDEGDVAAGLAVGVMVEVELEAVGKIGHEQLWFYGVLRHDELAPLGGEEGGHGDEIRIARLADVMAAAAPVA
jgi:hypothetical protein